MNKYEIINEETFYNYCYEKALKHNIKNWNLKSDDLEVIESYSFKIKDEFKEVSNLSFDEKIKEFEKYYLDERLEEMKAKSLKILKSCSSVFIARLEYLIISKVR